VFGVLGFAYNYKDGFDLQLQLKNTKEKLFVIKKLNVKFSVNTSIGKDTLSIKYYVPCSTMEQRTSLVKNLPVIKHGIMMVMNRPKMTKAIRKRDFKSIRKKSLKVINDYTIKKVDKIYLDYFSLYSRD
jgi:hypothetical protein